MIEESTSTGEARASEYTEGRLRVRLEELKVSSEVSWRISRLREA
jgi:hypothetical protein